ncbi:centromere protein M isoform X2 [Heterocephalus glaber]|uniref:Centromere protein M n=1 Tax=Heterocephalus glaber TaxID=10181 RepID=A0AAX6SYM4_HETGA|nr:centromere protein M isoform X2 [Heterocephalus glaber]
MSVLRPLDKLPGLNMATILLVGVEDALLQQLADSMLKEDCASEMRVHLAKSLPLPSNVNRPRIDLVVFVINLHSKYRSRGSCGLCSEVLSSGLFSHPAWHPKPAECGEVPVPLGRRLLPGQGVLPGHRGWAGQPLQHPPEHSQEAGPHLPKPPALL